MIKQFAGLSVLALLVGLFGVLNNPVLTTQTKNLNLAAVGQVATNNVATEVALVKEKNAKVLRVLVDHEKASVSEKVKLKLDLVETAKDRQKTMLKLLEKNPKAVLENRISKQDRARLPVEAREYVEDDASLTGNLIVSYIDGVNFKDYQTEYSIRTTDGKETRLHFLDNQTPRTQSGRKISTTGLKLANNLLLNGSNQSREFTQLEPDTRLSVTGAKKVAIILVNFLDNQTQSVTVEEVRQRVFTGSQSFPSVNKYYQDSSYGQLSLVGSLRVDGDIFGWYTLDQNSPTGCDYSQYLTSHDLAQDGARADGFVPSNYDMVSVVFPGNPTCEWAGRGSVGLSFTPARSSIISPVSYVFAHEFGHNLGLHHASNAVCSENGQPTTVSGICNRGAEYGNVFDVMGTGYNLADFNAMGKDYLGWFGASIKRLDSISGAVLITLSPIERKSTTNAIKIPYSSGFGSGAYFLESRLLENIGDSQNLSNVLLTTEAEEPGRSWLFDGHPQTPSVQDAFLPINQNIYLPKSDVVIKISPSANGNSLVQVGRGALPYIILHARRSADNQELQNGANLTSGETINVTWSAANQATGCKAIGAWSQAYADLPPAGQKPFTFTTPGAYDLGLTCRNSSGEAGQAIQLNVLATSELSITSPAGYESWPAGSRQTVRWSGGRATDSVSIYLFKSEQQGISGTLLASGPNDGLESVLLPIDAALGTYKIEIRSGGVITDSNFFYLSRPVPVVEITAKGKAGSVEVGPNESLQINWAAKYANSCSVTWNDSSNRPWTLQDQASSGTFYAPWLLSAGEKADVKVTCVERSYSPGYGWRDLGPRGDARLTIKSVNLPDSASLVVSLKVAKVVEADKSGQITLPYQLTLRNVSANLYPPYACFYLSSSNDPNQWKQQVEKVYLGCSSIKSPLANPTIMSGTLYAQAQNMPHRAYYLATSFGSENNYLLHFTNRLEFSFKNVVSPANNSGPSGGNTGGGPTTPASPTVPASSNNSTVPTPATPPASTNPPATNPTTPSPTVPPPATTPPPVVPPVVVPPIVNSCPAPYRQLDSHNNCQWSCGNSNNTQPNSATNQCVCRPNKVPVGTDVQGRLVCGNAPHAFISPSNWLANVWGAFGGLFK
ncbi:MAG: hypothetical protein AAB364_00185 [Patescibacteria group bacterium]